MDYIITMSQRKIRVGCLHGYGTNKKFLQRQMRSFKKQLSHKVQFIFLQSQWVPPSAYILQQKVLEKLDGSPRSWVPMKSYHYNHEKFIKNTVENLIKVLENGADSYDGLLGFSQGGAMLCTILRYIQNGKEKLKCLQNLKFCLPICSFVFSWNNISEHNQLKIPSLHIISTSDFLFRKSIFLTTQFESPQVIYHPFGHSFPRLGKQQANKILNFMIKSMKSQQNLNEKLEVQPKL